MAAGSWEAKKSGGQVDEPFGVDPALAEEQVYPEKVAVPAGGRPGRAAAVGSRTRRSVRRLSARESGCDTAVDSKTQATTFLKRG
jgi:hypothetical protein